MPRFDRRRFNRSLQKDLQKTDEEIMEGVREGFRDVLDFFETDSPIDSGWYQSNHRVVVGKGEPLVEGTREEQRRFEGTGQMAISDLTDREYPKLDAAKLGQVIRIANGVPHSEAVEFRYAIYARGEQILSARLRELRRRR